VILCRRPLPARRAVRITFLATALATRSPATDRLVAPRRFPARVSGDDHHGWKEGANGPDPHRSRNSQRPVEFDQLFVGGQRGDSGEEPRIVLLPQCKRSKGPTPHRRRTTVPRDSAVEYRPRLLSTVEIHSAASSSHVNMLVYHPNGQHRRFIDFDRSRTKRRPPHVGKPMKSWNPWKPQNPFHLRKLPRPP